jgi:hypothetical protein
MDRPRTPRRRPDAPSGAPTTLHEITRRYYATAITLAKAMGLPMSEQFIHEYRESIACCFIAADRAGVRLPPAVQLPPLSEPSADATTGQAPEASGAMSSQLDMHGSGMPPAPEATSNGHTPPVAIPADTDLPCRGQLLVDLKPASLSMLIGKLKGLAEAQGGRWVVLLQALQAERASRLARGKRPPVALGPPVEADGDVP